MLSLHYHELMRKTEEHKQKKYLMVNDYMPDKVLEKINDTKILIDTNDKLPDYIT